MGQITSQIEAFKKATMLDGSGKLLTSDIEALSAALGNLTIKQQAAILATQGFNSEQVAQVLAAQGATNAEIAQALATTGLIAKTKQLSYEQAYQNIVALAGNEEKAEAIIKSLGLTVAENGELVVEQNLTKEKILATAAQQGLNTAQAEGIATSLGYSGAASGLMNGLKGLGTQAIATVKSLLSLAKAHPIITAIVAIIAAVGGVAYYFYKQEKAAEEETERYNQKLKEEYSELQKTNGQLKDAIELYSELGDNTNLTEEQKSKLLSTQENLINTFGDEIEGIDLVNGKYQEQLDTLIELNREKSQIMADDATQLYRQTNREARDKYSDFSFNNIRSDETQAAYGGTPFRLRDDITDTVYDFATKIFSETDAKKRKKYQNKYGIDYISGNFSSEATLEQRKQYLVDYRKFLKDNTTLVQQDTVLYSDWLKDINNTIAEIDQAINNRDSSFIAMGENTVRSYVAKIDGKEITWDNLTPEYWQQFKSAIIEDVAVDVEGNVDTDLQKSIELFFRNNMDAYFDHFSYDVPTNKIFDFSTFYEENDLENVEKRLNKLKSAKKDLADGKLGTELGTDFYAEFPELLKYANASTETLTLEMAKLARIDVSQYVKELRLELEKATSPAQKQALQAAINILNGMADITTKIEEKTTKTSDLYKDEQSELKKQIEYTTKLVNDAESRKEAEENNLEILEKQKESLEKSISDYETAADTVQDYIDEQIENQNTLKEETEDRYDKEIQAIQDEIDALDKEADQRDRINDLREKELALEKAKNTKVRVYSAASGWSIQTDKQAVNVAQQEYDNALKDYKVDQLNQNKEDLTKAKEGATTEYDNEIKALEEYKTKWEEAVKSYQKAQDEMTTAATFGADWREQVINKDVNLVNGFVVSYNEAQTQLHNIVEPAIEQKEKEIDAIDREIDSYNTLKDKQKEYLNFFKTYAEDYAKVYTDTSNTLTKSWNEFAQAVRSNADASELFRLYENAMAAFNEDYTKTLPEYANGGVMSTTGLNIGHGTKQRSEVVFNAADAKKLYDMIHGSSVTHLANTVAGNFAKAAVESSGNVDNSKVMTNNSYTWQISGNDMKINNYAEFKGYMDRFIREAKQDMIVGK